MKRAIGATALFAAAALFAAGDDPEPAAAEPAPPLTGDTDRHDGPWIWLTCPHRWDAVHDHVCDRLVKAVDRIDRLFGDERFDDDAPGTRLRARFGVQYSDEDGFSVPAGLRLRLSLPRLEGRLKLIVDDDSQADDPDSARALADAVRDSPSDVALRFTIRESLRHALSFDGGVRGTSPVQSFGRVRARLTVPLAPWELRLTETAAWFTDDGFKQTTEMRWTRPMGDFWWFRSTSRLGWEEGRAGVTPSQALLLGRELGGNRAVRLETAGEWPETPHPEEARYSVEIAYRRRLHRNWLFAEIAPGIDFRQEIDYEPNPGIALRVEVIFGDDR